MSENSVPYILEETNDYAVLFKPPRMHSVPLKQKQGGTLLEWYAAIFPPVSDGGDLVHRLDFETQGLLLCAKNRKSLEIFRLQQESGDFVKEYTAHCAKAENVLPGFPPPPALDRFLQNECSQSEPFVIESFFRPYGPGRKQVRPVTGENFRGLKYRECDIYRTNIVNAIFLNSFKIRLERGFRHQIRCHLSWIGYPIHNDPLYGVAPVSTEGNFLALSCNALFFGDPSSGLRLEYRIEKP
ncbi:MAG: pseudouridine synthase [Treponema sp.]|nr:pseudouridine synthase [Treponema sp.]